MELNEYQKEAFRTDQSRPTDKKKFNLKSLNIPILGLLGEAGSIATEYKKKLRDGDSHKLFEELFEEELGDLLWYLANIATKMGLNLNRIAQKNLDKIKKRWPSENHVGKFDNNFDKDFPSKEQLPQKINVEIREEKSVVNIYIDGEKVGDPLTDNSYNDDGYRFHDVFHFAYVAILGWSPNMRKLLCKKRKSKREIDEVEDGQRAFFVEEAITIFIYSVAKEMKYFEKIKQIDWQLLKMIKKMVNGLEVSKCSDQSWEEAILVGYSVFRQVKKNRGGILKIDRTSEKPFQYVKSK